MGVQLTTTRSFSPAQMALIRKTIAKDCNEEEFNLFIEICKHQGLDPFRKQIYAFVFKKKGRRVKTNRKDHAGKWIWEDGPEERQLSPVTSIEGYRAKAQRHGDYRPDENEPEFEIDPEEKNPESNPAGIVKCTVTVWKFGPDKKWYPITGSARWSEYAPIVDDGEWKKGHKDEETNEWVEGEFKSNGKQVLNEKKPNWRKMPFIMLAKCAEANALRKGWPEEFSGLHVAEEFDRVDTEQTAADMADLYEKEERLKRTGGKDTIPCIINMTDGLQMIPIGQFADRALEHLRRFEAAKDVDFWREQNRHALREFWAREPGDALALKKEIESIHARLSAKEGAIDADQKAS